MPTIICGGCGKSLPLTLFKPGDYTLTKITEAKPGDIITSFIYHKNCNNPKPSQKGV